MIKNIYRIYSFLFARKIFYRFNKFLYGLSLRGLGILNYQSIRESGERFFLSKFCREIKEAVIFDVGANKGDYAKIIMRLDKDAIVHSFEPHPLVFQKLKEIAREYGFYAHNYGCGDRNGKFEFYDYAEGGGSSHASLYRDIIERIHKKKLLNVRLI